MLLTARKLVQRKMLDVDADPRGILRNFGLKVGVVGKLDLRRASASWSKTCPGLLPSSSRC